MDTKIQRVRPPAYKIPINVITMGRYVREEEDFIPNYIEFRDKKISRVNLIGIVVSLEEDERSVNSAVVDDGTAKISVRGFEQSEIPKGINVGDIINIIGRPREFGSEKYIIPEIIKKTNEKWMRVRKLEIVNIAPLEKKEEVVEGIEVEEVVEEGGEDKGGVLANHEKIIQYIKKNDQGKGVEIEDILRDINIENCERIVENMLKEGDLFETTPGILKVLE